MNSRPVAPYRAALIVAMTFFPAWSMARADDVGAFPSRGIRVVISFAAGGAADIVARALTQYTTAETGWQFYVENISGAGGLVGAQAAARAKADRYTLLLCNVSCVTNQFLQTNADWNPKSAISPVIVVGYVPNVVVVGPSVQAGSLADFIAQARTNPGHVSEREPSWPLPIHY
jgi:tripartite-type tricarboxylate transporter receptor subunit TctC